MTTERLTKNIGEHRPRKSPQRVPLVLQAGVRYFLIPVALLILAGLEGTALLSGAERHVALSGLLVTYASVEILYERIQRPEVWMVSPSVLTSLLSFVIPFALSNYSLVSDRQFDIIFLKQNLSYIWLNKAIVFSILGLMSMWLGYRLNVLENISIYTRNWLREYGIIKTLYNPSYWTIILLALVSTIARVVMVRVGGYGIMGTKSFPMISMYISWIIGLGYISLLVASIDCFSDSRVRFLKISLVLLLLSNEVFWGFLSAFKGRVVYPFIIVGVGYALGRRQIPKGVIAATCVALFAAYAIVQPYRRAIGSHAFNPRSLGEATTMLSDIAFGDMQFEEGGSHEASTLETASARMNLTGVAAAAIRYRDEDASRRSDVERGPRWEMILTSPIRAVVPRFVWPEKPTVAGIGSWFYLNVWGEREVNPTSVGMSIIGYLYIAGGIWSILVCFVFIGAVQRAVLDIFIPLGLGGVIVYAGLISIFAKLPTTFDAVIINLIRLVPLLILVQYTIINRK